MKEAITRFRHTRGASLRWLGFAALAAFAACGCGRSSSSVSARPGKVITPKGSNLNLVEVTSRTGVDFQYTSGYEAGRHSILQWMGGGVAILDYDHDGASDLFFAGGGYFEGDSIHGTLPSVYRNVGGFRFENVSSSITSSRDSLYTHGCESGDFDNDGFIDILMTGYGGLQLFHNQGDGTFIEVASAAGLDDDLWSTGAAWGDLNGDGNLDLYVVHYMNWSLENDPICHDATGEFRDACGPKFFEGLPDAVYYSTGAGTFERVTPGTGFDLKGKGLGVVIADLDRDFDLDIYVANDTTDNFLYLNNGSGQFEETALLSGVAGNEHGKPDGSMGVDVGDFDGDGQLDLWVTNFVDESSALYRNMGGKFFQHVSRTTGLTMLGEMYVGFGTRFADIDLDGDQDLIVVNGHVFSHPAKASTHQVPLLLRNDAGRLSKFQFPENEYFSTPHLGRGLALGDLDNDGDLDLLVTHLQAAASIIRNDTPDSSLWLQLCLIGRRVSRTPVGAVATLHTSLGSIARTVRGGGSYLSQNENRLAWGIPTGAELYFLTVSWPDGTEQRIDVINANRLIVCIQP